MSSGKFIPAIMQKNSTQLQRIKQQQLKSTCRFFQNKTKSQIPDMFVKKEDTTTYLGRKHTGSTDRKIGTNNKQKVVTEK